MTNWSELIFDFLEESFRRIKLYDGFLAFSIVCSLCRAVAVNFGCLCSHQKHVTIFVVSLKFHGKKCFSSKCWLVTIDLDWNMSILNLLSRVQDKLQPMRNKCALSINPSLSIDYLLIVIYGGKGKLAYFRLVSDISGCKLNCIYFTNNCLDTYTFLPEGGGKDIGTYDLQNGSIEPYCTITSLHPCGLNLVFNYIHTYK
ncbi:hypothetical protein ACOSP7_024301 [Xanthoceras sorbifolium]